MKYSKPAWAWALYDWANSGFATVVIAGFFPIALKQYWSSNLSTTDSTFYLGLANSLSSLFIVIIAPIIGAIADQGARRKKFLIIFACLGIVMTGCLTFIMSGQWVLALTFYVLATIGFMGGNIFYDAMLLMVSPKSKYDIISALGFSLGYLGGGLLMLLCVAMTLKPEWFGLHSGLEAARLSFVITAVWWAVFSIPLLICVKGESTSEVPFLRASKLGFMQLVDTFKHIKENKMIISFLLAYWLYIDGVDTIIRMAVDYGLSLGFSSNKLIIALLITNFVGFPATFLFGMLGKKIGAKRGILIGLTAYMCITIWGSLMEEVWEFYCIAITVGFFQGGVQALSRSLYASMIPPQYAAEYFGFYNMLGKFAAVLGPVLMGWIAVITNSHRLSILSILVFFILGIIILSKLKFDHQKAAV